VRHSIFVDTSAWFASQVPWDFNHKSALQFMQTNTQPLLTTDYVLDETLTLLKGKGEMARALQMGQHIFSGGAVFLHYLTTDEIAQAWAVFQKFKDKDWSFTDCTSKVVIEQLGITAAFAFDQHFHQFGTVVVVP
jgi:predicted nucleic acid-binding protein